MQTCRSSLVSDTMSLKQLCHALVLKDLRHLSSRIQRSPPYYCSISNNKIPANYTYVCTLSNTDTPNMHI